MAARGCPSCCQRPVKQPRAAEAEPASEKGATEKSTKEFHQESSEEKGAMCGERRCVEQPREAEAELPGEKSAAEESAQELDEESAQEKAAKRQPQAGGFCSSRCWV
mmetsp:Transcript_129264/g.234843  ORF Transcript_129264/g.234843 Transcript_129264/m.234843 type:complete len:107 (-) Transcript_129264:316-636(-)